MEIFEWNENIPVTANNLNEMQNQLNENIELAIEENNPVVLFEDSVGQTGAITLNDNKNNYKQIEIFASSNGGAAVSVKVLTNLSIFEMSTIDDNAYPTQQKLWLKWGKYNFGDTSITPTYQAWTEMTSNPSTTFVTSNFAMFKIYKVLGYK